jgi:hypothetical protein
VAASAADEVYERLIRPLPPEQRLRLLARIATDLVADEPASTGSPLHNVMEFYGVGRRSWDGSDAQEFVNKLRRHAQRVFEKRVTD